MDDSLVVVGKNEKEDKEVSKYLHSIKKVSNWQSLSNDKKKPKVIRSTKRRVANGMRIEGSLSGNISFSAF